MFCRSDWCCVRFFSFLLQIDRVKIKRFNYIFIHSLFKIIHIFILINIIYERPFYILPFQLIKREPVWETYIVLFTAEKFEFKNGNVQFKSAKKSNDTSWNKNKFKINMPGKTCGCCKSSEHIYTFLPFRSTGNDYRQLYF